MTPASVPRHLFVYGTLKSGFQNPYARMLRARAQLVSTAWVRGQLYNLGAYPGLVAADDTRSRVHGELFRIEPSAAGLLSLIDRYEGCDRDSPEPHAFMRWPAVAHLKDGTKRLAWAYYYTGSTAGRPRISSGRFTRL